MVRPAHTSAHPCASAALEQKQKDLSVATEYLLVVSESGIEPAKCSSVMQVLLDLTPQELVVLDGES